MAWYSQPIQPMDPINKEQEQNQAIRYLRDSFTGTGQDSNTTPPSQDQSMWQQLTNVMPITQASLSRRWGYNSFASYVSASGFPTTRMYSLQNNNTLIRQIVYSAQGDVSAGPEAGPTIANIFIPTASTAPRMVDSRNYAYFFDGFQQDSLKWDGVATTSNWGIDASNVTASLAGGGVLPSGVGPNPPTSGTDLGGEFDWNNPGNITVQDGNSSTCPVVASNATATSNIIRAQGFGFTLPAANAILGIQVDLIASGLYVNSSMPVTTLLSKTGTVAYGQSRYKALATGQPLTKITFGGPTDLWGGTWTAADINSATFATFTQFNKPQLGLTATMSIDFVQVTVFTNLATGTVSSGSGVGIQGEVPGDIVLTVGRTYYLSFKNSITGHYSDLSPASISTGPGTNVEYNLLLAVHNDPQVDTKAILATADGGDPSILYLVAEVPNSQTTYTDDLIETSLELNQQYLFTDPYGNEFGVTFNDPPPLGTVCIKHKGRLWMAQQQNLFFSKAVAELTLPNGFIAGKYEESWNPSNYFDISGGAETISGLFSDGNVIYIGTQSHIRRIFGDSPTNFQQPEICHQDVGVINQEVWQNVFLEGTPTGFMWLSPDFKVMGSDGNTYLDIGHPIQDVLNTINPLAAPGICTAMFVQQGPFDLFILAIPTGTSTFCDTLCVFDLRAKQWVVWTPSDPATATLFNLTAAGVPQWLFASQEVISSVLTNTIFQFVPTATVDQTNRGNSVFIATATTSWLHLGSPVTRKVLDELDIIGDSTMTVSIFGASTQADFNSPITIVVNAPLVESPFQTLKLYLSGKTARYRYYQFQFQSTAPIDTFLNSYNLRALPWNTL